MAELAASGVKAIRTVYADGGQNPVFAGYKDTSDPDALVGGPQEIALSDAAKPAPAVVKVAVADATRQGNAAVAPEATGTVSAAPEELKPQTIARASTAATEQSGIWGASTRSLTKWLNLGGQDKSAQPAITAYIPEQPIPTDVPLPPRRDEKSLHVAFKTRLPPSKPDEAAAAKAHAPDASQAAASGASPAAAVVAPAAQ